MTLPKLLLVIKQRFHEIPEKDVRASIGPLDFVSVLVFSFLRDRGKRTIGSLRRSVIAETGIRIDRGSFWERMAAGRLQKLLTRLALALMEELGKKVRVTSELLSLLGVGAILLLDSTSSTLPKKARKAFPAPRKNVVPAAIKVHSLFDLFGGRLSWFSMTAAKNHDRKGFPPLELLRGALIIFDLGYWDYLLFAELAKSGIFFLSRIKTNAVIRVIQVIEGLPKKSSKAKTYLEREFRKDGVSSKFWGSFDTMVWLSWRPGLSGFGIR